MRSGKVGAIRTLAAEKGWRIDLGPVDETTDRTNAGVGAMWNHMNNGTITSVQNDRQVEEVHCVTHAATAIDSLQYMVGRMAQRSRRRMQRHTQCCKTSTQMPGERGISHMASLLIYMDYRMTSRPYRTSWAQH